MRRLGALPEWAIAAVLSGNALLACSSGRQAGEANQLSDLRSTVLAHEELIAACMKEAGFDYVAIIPPDVLMEEARSLAEQRGEDPEAAVDALDLPEDPNTKITDGLSPAELTAYEKAFWGQEGGEGTLRDDEGCYYSTYEEAWGVDLLTAAPEFADNLDTAEPASRPTPM